MCACVHVVCARGVCVCVYVQVSVTHRCLEHAESCWRHGVRTSPCVHACAHGLRFCEKESVHICVRDMCEKRRERNKQREERDRETKTPFHEFPFLQRQRKFISSVYQ